VAGLPLHSDHYGVVKEPPVRPLCRRETVVRITSELNETDANSLNQMESTSAFAIA
jgi:hypothetical protein